MPSHEPNIQKEVNTLILFRVRDFPSRKMKCTTLAKGCCILCTFLCRSQALHKHFIGFTLIPAVYRTNLQSILKHRGANCSLEMFPAFRLTGAEICTSLATGQGAVLNLATKTTLNHLSSLSLTRSRNSNIAH